jgi:carbon monoxide dehydrogenase subunit G
MSIHQQTTIPADPQQVYAVLANAEALSALSGMPGRAAGHEGEEFSAFDGHVVGRQIELVPG